MKKRHLNLKRKNVLISLLSFLGISFPLFFLKAQEEKSFWGLKETAKHAGYGKPVNLSIFIGQLIGYFLSFIGVIFFLLILYGGFQWMTAGGNEEKIKKAKSLITNAVIGLVIVLAADSITWFVVDRITQATLISQ